LATRPTIDLAYMPGYSVSLHGGMADSEMNLELVTARLILTSITVIDHIRLVIGL